MSEVKNLEVLRKQLFDFLHGQSIERLRAVARHVGVERATTKKKGDLVDEIIAVEQGEIPVAPETNRGAPIKNDFVDPKIISKIEEFRFAFYASQHVDDNSRPALVMKKKEGEVFEFHSNDYQEEGLYDADVHVGQLAVHRDAYCLFPLDGNYENLGEELIVVPLSIVEKHRLAEGDIVSCSVERRGKIRLLTRVLSVGSRVQSMEKFDFEKEKVGYPTEKLRLSEFGRANLATKVLDLFAPSGFGERILVAADGRRGQNEFIMSLASSLYKRTDVRLIFLSLSASPEKAADLREILEPAQIVTATYDQGLEHVLFAADFALKRAKRLVERHQSVCLIVDSMNTLVRAYNAAGNIDGGRTLSCGLETKSLQYAKEYLGSGRNFQNRISSLTVIGGLSLEGEDGADEVLRQELGEVATVCVKLTEDNPALSPVVDFSATKTDRKWRLLTDEENAFVQKCLTSYLPTYGRRKLCEKLSENENVATTMSALNE